MHAWSHMIGPMTGSLVAIAMAFMSMWLIGRGRTRGRRAVEARLAALGETAVEISPKPFYGAAWATAGLTAGAVIFRVVARTAAGEELVHEWAYDPMGGGDGPNGGLKTFAHGIWIPVA